MYSIQIDNNIITDISFIEISSLKQHEEVVLERKDSLKLYLKSLSPEVLISSIIVCNQTNMIIDGHHRFSALSELGVKKIPVTFVNYSSEYILPYFDNRIDKDTILNACINKTHLKPKSSKHVIYDFKTQSWKPIILISSLFCLELDAAQ